MGYSSKAETITGAVTCRYPPCGHWLEACTDSRLGTLSILTYLTPHILGNTNLSPNTLKMSSFPWFKVLFSGAGSKSHAPLAFAAHSLNEFLSVSACYRFTVIGMGYVIMKGE